MSCPYVPSHIVKRSKFSKHVNNCRSYCLLAKDTPFHSYATRLHVCVGNNSHHVTNIEFHHRNCPDAIAYLENEKWGYSSYNNKNGYDETC